MGLYVPRPRLAVGSYAGGGNGLLNDLLAYWAMDEASGNLLDSSAAGRTVTQQTTIGTADGKVYGTARLFDESAKDYATRDDAVLESLNVFTCAMWLYPVSYYDSGGNQFYMTMVSTDCGQWAHGWKLFHNRSGQLVFELTGGAGPDTFLQWHTGVTPPLNTWSSVVVWHNPSADVAGIDYNGGTTSKTTAYAHDLGAGLVDFCFGRTHAGGDSYYYDGRLGPVAIWDRVLTSVDRALWYNGGLGLAYSGFEP